MHAIRSAAFRILDAASPRGFPSAPRAVFLPLDLDADCPWRTRYTARRRGNIVGIGAWVLLALLAFAVCRVLMSR